MSDEFDSKPFETGVLPVEMAHIAARRLALALQPQIDLGGPLTPNAGGDGGTAQPHPTPDRGVGDVPKALADAHRISAFGLAFSGGGIRSATFNLGIVQGIAEKNLLRYVDYLSTVSGGGYIGSWLHGVIRNRHDGNPVAATATLLAGTNRKPGGPDQDPITFLRKYSNYLAPRPGLFSADTWVIAFIWLRNFLLNQLILLPAIAAVAATALLIVFIRQMPAPDGYRRLGFDPLAALVAIISVVAAAVIMVRNLRPVARQSLSGDPVDRTPKETAAEHRSLIAVALVFTATVALGAGYFEANRPLVRAGVPVVFVLLMALIQWGGGFIDCFAASRETAWRKALARLHVVWMATVSGLLAAALVAGVWTVVAGWPAWTHVAFGPPLVSLSFIAAVMLLVGLMGADYPDAAREWTARLGSILGILTAAWTALFGLVVFGPRMVASLLITVQWLGLSAIAGWLVTTLGGVLAGRSARTNASGTGIKKALELVIAVAPTIFLVGYLLLIAAGVHVALARLSPGTLISAAPVSTTARSSLYEVSVTAPAGREVEFSVKPAEDGQRPAWLLSVTRFRDRYFHVLTLAGHPERALWLLVILLGCCVVTAVASGRININEFSLHHFYKNRLVRCYLGASKSGSRRPNPFTGFDPLDDFPIASLTPDAQEPDQTPRKSYLGPYPIVSAALNLNTGSELAQQERKATSFVFTPAFCGFDPPSSRESRRELDGRTRGFDPDGYRPTRGYAYPSGPSMGTTAAISGAAASPNMGFHTSGPMAFLLTVFNARLGWWLGNPRWARASQRPGPMFALRYLFAELLGQTTGVSKFVNLSDGGHFDNLGLYELVRRRCRFIILCDAEEDIGFTFGALGGAIRKCRADFGVEIDINPDPIRIAANGFSKAHCVVGRIAYPEQETAFAAGMTTGVTPMARPPTANNNGPARGWLLYLKASLTGDEPADVIEYRSRAAEFPHQSTADQFFSESQFESYRRLGYHVLRSAFEGVTMDRPSQDPLSTRYPLIQVFQTLTRNWYAPIPVTDEAATRLADAYVEIMRVLAQRPELQALQRELVRPDQSSQGQQPPPGAEMIGFGMELMQLMQNVYTEFKLEHEFNRANPRNSGWISVFAQWLQSDLLYNRIWPRIRNDYHALFASFVDDLRRNPTPDVPNRP